MAGFADAGVKANRDKSMTLSAKSLRDVLHEFLFGAIFFYTILKYSFFCLPIPSPVMNESLVVLFVKMCFLQLDPI